MSCSAQQLSWWCCTGKHRYVVLARVDVAAECTKWSVSSMGHSGVVSTVGLSVCHSTIDRALQNGKKYAAYLQGVFSSHDIVVNTERSATVNDFLPAKQPLRLFWCWSKGETLVHSELLKNTRVHSNSYKGRVSRRPCGQP